MGEGGAKILESGGLGLYIQQPHFLMHMFLMVVCLEKMYYERQKEEIPGLVNKVEEKFNLYVLSLFHVSDFIFTDTTIPRIRNSAIKSLNS